MHFINWLKNLFHYSCYGCIVREHECARLIEENRELRNQLHEVISNQNDMLRDILKLNQPPKQNIDREMNPVQMRKLSTIRTQISEAERKDREEYDKRIAAESNDVKDAS